MSTRKPGNSNFKQQKLPAWKPILTPRTALPVFYIVGAIFVIFGAVLLSASNSVSEVTVDYTNCVQTGATDTGTPCATLLATNPGYINNTIGLRCQCKIPITITENFASPAFIYYELTNYFQNHRQYVKSRDDSQLRSVTSGGGSNCAPLQTNNAGISYTPCGLIANSIFNDTIILSKCSDSQCINPVISRIDASGKDISWSSDRDVKFKNPSFSGADLCTASAFVNGATPPNWPVPTCQIGTTVNSVYNPFSPAFNSTGEGYENEDFIVWMRTAALPTFRKLYRKLLTPINKGDVIQIAIDYNYPVAGFKGQKHVVISSTNWMGGKNQFLGIAYIVVGGLSLILAIIFTIITATGAFRQRKLGDLDYLKWQ